MWAERSAARFTLGALAATLIASAVEAAPRLPLDTFTATTANMTPAGTHMILGQVTYAYTPAVQFGPTGPFDLTDSMLMLPRISEDIPLS